MDAAVSALPPGGSRPDGGKNQQGMKLRSLQALRAIAAWLVVADHALLDITHNTRADALTPIAWVLGSVGVSVFFVISGFIMVHISWNDFARAGATAKFLRRRIVRIVPLYWLATLAALAFHQVSATHGSDAGWPQLIRSLLFIPYFDGPSGWTPILPQGWTLSYEMMFYAIFAIALALPRWIGFAAVGGSLGALTLAGPFLPPGVVAHLASPIALWFVLGIALGACWHLAKLREPRWLARWAQPLEPFGDASYSTYLVHGLILTILFRLWTMLAGAPSLWFVPAGLVATTAAGCAVHVFIERPALRLATHPRALINDVGARLRARRQSMYGALQKKG
jgi:exopolysaccharide production protein ExoZ